MPWCVPGLTSEKSRPLGDQKSCLSLGSIPYIAIWITSQIFVKNCRCNVAKLPQRSITDVYRLDL
jgi:hypothetical protein